MAAQINGVFRLHGEDRLWLGVITAVTKSRPSRLDFRSWQKEPSEAALDAGLQALVVSDAQEGCLS